MQISSFSLTSSVSPIKTITTAAASTTTTLSNEQADTNFTTSADSFSSLVAQASQMPDVRGELVDSFKARIAAGQYPTPDTINDLTDYIGSRVVQLADSAPQE